MNSKYQQNSYLDKGEYFNSGNTAFFFIPFTYKKTNYGKLRKNATDYFKDSVFIKNITNSSNWQPQKDLDKKTKYMFKYISDKIINEENRVCFCYDLIDENRRKLNIPEKDVWCEFSVSNKKTFAFQIISVQLFCFSTSVSIMTFQVRFLKNDYLYISSAEYNMKKVSTLQFSTENNIDQNLTLLGIAKEIMVNSTNIELDYFFFANNDEERANVLTYLSVDGNDSNESVRMLYYLKRCYNEGYLYNDSDSETYIPSNDTIWGITSEAAAVIVYPDMGRAKFLHNTFYNNFQSKYLLTYVFLLHQKYVLYKFLTQIGIGTYNDIDTLESYRQELYEFETDFVFSNITEVPQYQNFCDKLSDVFAITKMYNDVHEPIESLTILRHKEEEDIEKSNDRNTNIALFLLSALAIFSALIDSFDFCKEFKDALLSNEISNGQYICLVVIGIIAVIIIAVIAFILTKSIRLNISKKKHRKKNEK